MKARIGLIYAGARCCWPDETAALPMLAAHGVEVHTIAVNDRGAQIRRLNHWTTLHSDAEHMGKWERQRVRNGHPGGYVRWGQTLNPWCDRECRNWAKGSSGLYAVDVALNGLSLDGAVLVGMPMDQTPNAFRDETGWAHFERHRYQWTEPDAWPFLQRSVRSMSGWTRSILGAPTAEWLAAIAGTGEGIGPIPRSKRNRG